LVSLYHTLCDGIRPLASRHHPRIQRVVLVTNIVVPSPRSNNPQSPSHTTGDTPTTSQPNYNVRASSNGALRLHADDQPQEQEELVNDDDDDDEVKSWRCDVCFKVFDSYKMACIHEDKCVEASNDADTGEVRKKTGTGWNWIQQDYNDLERLVAATERPIDFDAIGRQMNPIRGARACLNMANKRGISMTDDDGCERVGNVWSWIQQDYDALERLVAAAKHPIAWSLIGRQMNPIRTANACHVMVSKRGISVAQQKHHDDDGRKRNGVSWTWVQQDYDALERLVAATDDPIDWDEIGRQMNPVRSAKACQGMANTKGIYVAQQDDASRKWKGGTVWTWIQQDYDILEQIVAAAEDPIDWGAIGSQMSPLRSASACKNMAYQRGIIATQQQDDDAGRKQNGTGWNWIQQDYNDLERLVAATERPIDFDAIGRQMNPTRGARACLNMASKRRMSMMDDDGRERDGTVWSWIKKDYDALEQLVAAAGVLQDWDAIGRQMKPIRTANACHVTASKRGISMTDADGRKWSGNGWT
jgi:hypothetical protein